MEGDRVEAPPGKRGRRGQPATDKWEGSELEPAGQLPEGQGPRGPTHPESMAAGRREAEKRIREARGGSEGNEQAGSEKAGANGGTPPTDNSEELAALKKYLDKLGSDWWPQKSKDGTKMWLRNPDGSGKTTAIPFEEKLWDVWVENLTEKGRQAFVKSGGVVEKTAKKGGEKGEPMALADYITKRVEDEVPVVRNVLAKMSWFQNAVYDIGLMAFLRISRTPNLLADDTWELVIHEAPGKAEMQDVRKAFDSKFEDAMTQLIRGMNSVQEIVKLEEELSLESGRLLLERKKHAETQIKADYYESFARIAQASMCANDSKEFFERLVVKGLVDAQSRAQIAVSQAAAGPEAPSAQIAGGAAQKT